ncbi:c-type cytochrome [Paraburkholderia terricola]|uniref:Mono/diheme cytochrome c family protein n=1 Tax=Paraburkholderia terricola TaxID=169427 RepID=A0ABU1LKC9_9BURK|nr:c-type cytochrome [Paraburkholderia terricola]MDR6407203.1 mono/diheme cytochrome c family protein [Paraburkholderia terricola]MDR6479119.1 mono/diheme cytochrome c family protein [Paraburkholderia terricola]
MTRKPILLAATGASIVAALIVAVWLMWKPAIAPVSAPPASSFDSQTRLAGARVVALGDCIVCHTAKGGKPFAGGLPLATPFGTIYATNITPDVQTGIGNWSLEAFTRAVRHGVARDGHLLYPAFPYIHFTRMSDPDIAAAYAYLMTREPVSASAPPNDLIFPLNFRPLLAFWNVLFLRAGERPAETSKDAEWNRGKLLVDGLGHCASCHSPLDAIGGEKSGHAFDGGMVDGWEAPALNALGGAPKPWTKEQLVAYLRSGRASEHGAAAGPMLPVTRDLASVPEQDVEAIATYILSIQKPRPAVANVSAQAAEQGETQGKTQGITQAETSASAQRGAILFGASCAQCHGPAAPMQAIGERPTLAYSTAVNAATPRNAIQMMLGGIGWHGADTMNYMPAFGEIYSDRQIADLAAYIRATYSQRGAWNDVEATVAKVRKENNAR